MAKKKEPAKILLVNFDEKTARAVAQATGVQVVRGYISDGDTYIVNRLGVSVPSYDFYLPTPPYECAMVFVNFESNPALREEFKSQVKSWSETETNNFYRYWSFRSTLLVYFIGETRVSDLVPFGLPLELVQSSGVDKQTVVTANEDSPHANLIEVIDEQLKMPNSKYIRSNLNDTELYGMNTKKYDLIHNSNGNRLAVALTKDNDDYSMDEPGAIVLPMLKRPSDIMSKIIKHFAKYHDLSLSSDEWHESDSFYPKTDLARLNNEIEQILEVARKDVDARQQQVVSIRTDYSYLKDLLTEQGDALVEAVYKVLTDQLKLDVTKSDEQNSSSPKEDLLVKVGDRQILLEVKGTKRQNPSLKFPQQAMQHAIRQGLTNIASTGLVLNHDRESDPSGRTLAYSDKESKELITDIHFIDTRVMHAVAVDVIDEKLEPKNAVKILFNKPGRATYLPTE